MSDIREQIEDARAAATEWYPLDLPGAAELVVALNGYADAMEKLLAVYKAAKEIYEWADPTTELQQVEMLDLSDALNAVQTK